MRWSLAPWERSTVLGDLEEEARAIAAQSGERAARRWYWRQAILSLWPNVLRRFKGDERRREAFYGALSGTACWVLVLLGALTDTKDTKPPGGYAFWCLLGATNLWSLYTPLFATRLKPAKLVPGPRLTTLRVVGGLMAAVFVWVLFHGPSWALWVLLILIWIPRFIIAPPEDTASEAHTVSYAALQDRDRERYFWWRVPNEPAGVGDLVLCRTTEFSDLAGPSADSAMIQRRFSPGVTLRVCSAVNLTGVITFLRLEIADSSGRVIWSKPVEIRPEPLTEIPDNWDDLADRDAATHFGAIDELVSLQGLEPGRYTLRLTATAGDRSTTREDQIEVTA
jgi:hypothetical protein